MSTAAPEDGINETAIPFISVIRESKPTPLEYGVVDPSFCIVVQGEKEVHIGRDIVCYAPGHYLASMIDMPMAGHVIGATRDAPYLGIKMDFSTEELVSVVIESKLDIVPRKRLAPGAFVAQAGTDLLDSFFRLLALLSTPEDIGFISPLIKREIIYRLLTGENGPHFYQNSVQNPQLNGIGNAIRWIKENYTEPFTAKALAERCHVSVSTLQHKFKSVTTMSPLQYQKQLRLHAGRRLLIDGLADVTTAAMEVGYESPSQFSREYRRLFGMPPLKDSRVMQKKRAQDSPCVSS